MKKVIQRLAVMTPVLLLFALIGNYAGSTDQAQRPAVKVKLADVPPVCDCECGCQLDKPVCDCDRCRVEVGSCKFTVVTKSEYKSLHGMPKDLRENVLALRNAELDVIAAKMSLVGVHQIAATDSDITPIPKCCGANLDPQNNEVQDKTDHSKRPRGRKVDPEKTKALHEAAFKRHGHRMKALSNTTLDSFDCVTAFGNVLPTDDQGQCGGCYGVSSADVCSMSLIKAGILPLDGSKGRLSSQYGLDFPNAFQGGCNGGDEAQVIDYIKNTGFPLTSDYGPYTASPGRAKDVSGMKFFKISDWGYCTPSQQQGIASAQDVMNALVRYGPVSTAFDASCLNNYTGGIITGRGTDVDHAVIITGWKTVNGKIVWKVLNQWGTSFGIGGYFWIEDGSYSICTEAIWVSVIPVTPPAPTPVPPAPTPVPPTPSPVGIPTFTISASIPAGTYEAVPAGTVQAVLDVAAASKKLNDRITPTLPPAPGPALTIEQRLEQHDLALKVSLDAIVKMQSSITDLKTSVDALQKLVSGK